MNGMPSQPRRRKKRPIHGLKTVDVSRGKSGYGFTISGQHPCVLSCIINNSPADRVGLRPGDYLMSVNGIDVSKHSHDDVVCMVGTSTGTLTIQVAENYNSSDSSDDEYYHRTKAKYPHRSRRAHREQNMAYGDKMEKLLGEINHRSRHLPDGTSHRHISRPISKQDDGKFDLPKPRSSRPRLHMPVGAENHEIQAEGTSYIEAGASNLFKVPFQKSASTSQVPSAASAKMHHYVEPKQAFIKSTSQGHVKSLSGGKSYPSRSHPSHMSHGHMYDQFSPNSLQQIINHSLHSYSAANEAFILNEDDIVDEEEEGPIQPEGGEVRIVVGYVGSLEMPGNANQPHVRIQSIRNAVRRLRVEQKIHTLVLMVVIPNYGVKLVNMAGKEIAFYPVEKLAFSGVCPDDRRFFGIVTLRTFLTDSETDSDSQDEMVGSSCHVFMVDQELAAHSMHAQKARTFNIECRVDPNTQRCQEFPRSTTPIILSISNLYKDRPSGAGMEVDMERSQVFANPNRPEEHAHTSSSSSSNSNSDSGVGLLRDDDRAAAGEIPPPLPARTRPPPPQPPTVKWSGNTMYLTDGPLRQARNTVQGQIDQTPPSSKVKSENSNEAGPENDKLNVRAMPTSTPPATKGRSAGDGLDDQNAAENLRIGMQKLLQARQRTTNNDQTSSDTESRTSKSDLLLSTSDLTERPLSAPFKYLSNEPQTDTKPSKSNLNHIRQNSDSNLADKLSPRAFLSSAFSPVSSSRPGARQKHSRSRLHEKRSPSAPPLPSYHGDDEDSEDDMNGLIKRLQKDKILGTTTDSIELRKLDITAVVKQRDQERRGVSPVGSPELSPKNGLNSSIDRWSNGKSGSVKQKGLRRNPLSLSHESLVVLEQDPMQQKLTSANSVNSIVHHVASEKEQGGRVGGWAVSFHRLLTDNVGITVFTDFLKKEFSEENIEFWKMCEEFKSIADSNSRKSKAREIYDKHVSMQSSDPVNIDSVLRKEVESQLDNPSTQTFTQAQLHIFQLMKQDSYSRFLKSDLYKSYIVREMEGQPLVSPGPVDKNALLEKDGKKKGKENNEEQKEKRRRSLLPWRHKSKKASKTENESKNQKSNKEKEATKDSNMNNLPLTANAPTTIDTVASKRTQAEIEVPDTIDEEPEQPRFCRVIMPDGSTTVVGTKQGQTINYVLGKLCEKRGLSIASVDVFLLGSEKLLNLNEDISTLGSKEVTIDRRVLFRMDLPNKKCIGVKAKPNRLIRDVFKPILHKYGYKMEDIDVHLIGQPEFLCLDDLVSTIDSQRVIVLATDQPEKLVSVSGFNSYSTSRPPLPNKYTSKHGLLINPKEKHINPKEKHINPKDRLTNNNNNDDLTNQIFGSLMLDKSDHLLAHNFDELGILDAESRAGKVEIAEALPADTVQSPSTENTAADRVEDPGKSRRSKQRVTFALQKNTFRNRPLSDDGDIMSQTLTLEDQRSLMPKQLQYPNVPHGGEPRDLMSEIDDYIESINENFAAYTREGTPQRSLTHAGETPKSALKSTNKSFSEDSIVPSNEDADKLFQSNPSSDADFSDPHLTEKSLTDIGFSYSHNKYLARSRNFVNQRKVVRNTPPVCVQFADDDGSPNRTLQSFAYKSDVNLLDTTVINSPHSSPYSSDSSMEKENVRKVVPKNRFRVRSRHTVIHSPSASDSDNFLSTVDTDTTPVAVCLSNAARLSNAACTPKVLDNRNPINLSNTDEVTFV